MAKKTLQSIKECPIDFLYLWASDSFISQLGSKAKIIRQKKANQYQTLWKTMIENVKAGSTAEYQEIYAQWTSEIGAAIESTYGMKPATILQKLAMGENVLGKNWREGVYGIGGVQTTFVQNAAASVDTATGMVLINGVAPENQTPIYTTGADGNATISGYSYYDAQANCQYQSGVSVDGQFGAVCYTNSNGVQTATGGNFDPSTGSFWQNANNYIPLINQVLSWVSSLVNSFFPNRTVLTNANTLPEQTEWVEAESDNNGLLIAGGLLAAGLVAMEMGKPKSKRKIIINK